MGRVLLAHLAAEELDEFFRHAELKRFTRYTVTDEAKIRKGLIKVREQDYCLSDQETELDRRTILAHPYLRLIDASHPLYLRLHRGSHSDDQGTIDSMDLC